MSTVPSRIETATTVYDLKAWSTKASDFDAQRKAEDYNGRVSPNHEIYSPNLRYHETPKRP